MIDPTLRLEHLAAGGRRPGHRGDPARRGPRATAPSPTRPRCSAPAVAAVGKPVVAVVVGTAADPQGLDRQVQALADAGAEVHLSNARATRRAVELLP